MQCRDMPGYPKVDRQSDYLIARYDGAVLDAKPWGRGAQEPAQSAQSLGYTGQQAVVLQQLLRKEVCLSQPLCSKQPPALESAGPSSALQRLCAVSLACFNACEASAALADLACYRITLILQADLTRGCTVLSSSIKQLMCSACH